MKQYQVTITEILQRSIWVRAESRQEAEQRVKRDYDKEKYILDAEDLKEITFCAEEAKRQCQRER